MNAGSHGTSSIITPSLKRNNSYNSQQQQEEEVSDEELEPSSSIITSSKNNNTTESPTTTISSSMDREQQRIHDLRQEREEEAREENFRHGQQSQQQQQQQLPHDHETHKYHLNDNIDVITDNDDTHHRHHNHHNEDEEVRHQRQHSIVVDSPTLSGYDTAVADQHHPSSTRSSTGGGVGVGGGGGVPHHHLGHQHSYGSGRAESFVSSSGTSSNTNRSSPFHQQSFRSSGSGSGALRTPTSRDLSFGTTEEFSTPNTSHQEHHHHHMNSRRHHVREDSIKEINVDDDDDLSMDDDDDDEKEGMVEEEEEQQQNDNEDEVSPMRHHRHSSSLGMQGISTIHNPGGGGDNNNNIQQETDNNTTTFYSNHHHNTTTNNNNNNVTNGTNKNRKVSESEDFFNHFKAMQSAAKKKGMAPAFYESDAEDNSVLYTNHNNRMGGMFAANAGGNNSSYRSVSSLDQSPPKHQYSHHHPSQPKQQQQQQQQQHSHHHHPPSNNNNNQRNNHGMNHPNRTPPKNTNSSGIPTNNNNSNNADFNTPHISNVSKQQQKQQKHRQHQKRQQQSKHKPGNDDHHVVKDSNVLPYHKRIEERNRVNYNEEQVDSESDLTPSPTKIDEQEEITIRHSTGNHNNSNNNNNNNWHNQRNNQQKEHHHPQQQQQQSRPVGLSTISGTPKVASTSPGGSPRGYHNHLPPSGNNNHNSQQGPRTHNPNFGGLPLPRARTQSSDSNWSGTDNDATPGNPSSSHNLHNKLPLHPKHQKQQHPSQNGKQKQQNPYPYSENQNQYPPTRHVRAESSGSVSSLGSMTGGASFVKMKESKTLKNDIQEYLQSQINNNNNNNGQDDNIHDYEHGSPAEYQHNPPSGAAKSHRGRERSSSGFLSSIWGSLSGSSFGSISLEDKMADFHDKNQKFLKKTEREKEREKAKQLQAFIKNANNSKKNGIPDFRPPSPAPSLTRRTHRPGLASIDNDDWTEPDEDDNEYGQKAEDIYKSQNVYRNGNSEGREGSRKKSGNMSNYGSTNSRHSNSKSRSGRRKKSGHNLNETGETQRMSNLSRNRRKEVEYDSDESMDDDDESESESDISSDFTSNQEVRRGKNRHDHDASASDGDLSYDEGHEQTALLPPSGISTHESERLNEKQKRITSRSKKKQRHSRHDSSRSDRSRKSHRQHKERKSREKFQQWEERAQSIRNEKHRKKRKGSHRSKRYDISSDESNSSSDYYTEKLNRKAFQLLARERDNLVEEWKQEWMEQVAAMRAEEEYNRWYNRFSRCIMLQVKKIEPIFSDVEQFISNLPLTIGAVALAIATLGVVWFKFAEEMMDSCQPVHFHSSQCHFPEFPGCFYCDTDVLTYKVALGFHKVCLDIAGVITMLFFAKLLLARQVVIDEMNSPTTSSPAGLICMTMVMVFAGQGKIGQIVVTFAASMHFCLAVWFIYMAGAYHILPDPSWYPNTVGIGISAVKAWLYYPVIGHFLMVISLSLGLFFFPISVYRVAINRKISATSCWIQMSAPAVSLYALTIMAQPSFEEEHPDITRFQRLHRMVYLPCMHFLFVMVLVGMVSSVQSLMARWKSFRKTKFSAAHAAFCFPSLAHVNAIQAYRGALDAFSEIEPRSLFKLTLDTYWIVALIVSSFATIVITTKFFYMLPSWTKVDMENELEPPAPHNTILSEVIMAGDGETLRQDFVSPAILQANETGALVRTRDHDGRTKYRRTRRVTALGFEPIMNLMEFTEERERLLDWVEKNPPRTRKRTLSVPHITYNLGEFGSNNAGVFSGPAPEMSNNALRRARTQTSDGNYPYSAAARGF